LFKEFITNLGLSQLFESQIWLFQWVSMALAALAVLL